MTTALASEPEASLAVFERNDELNDAHHELVAFCRDEEAGLRAIVAIHSTALGPALGGTRFYPYASESDALTDVLRLSQGMTFKAAAAGMPLGGGKAVIIGDPATVKSADLLRAYGRFIERLNGTYITAADVGTTSADLDIVGEETTHVVGRNRSRGGSGDSGFATAYGVHCAMTAAAAVEWGDAGLRGRTVGVEGVGKVGFHLVGLLLDDGADVVVSDLSAPALVDVKEAYDGVRIVDRVVDAELDVYAPCAMGGTLDPESARAIRSRIVCGAANNQLLRREVDTVLADRGIVWIPDYVANAGGLIQVGSELVGAPEDEVLDAVRRVGDTVTQILTDAQTHRITPSLAAQRIVERRLKSDGGARSIR
jgi:valine dehydrogenase (NAD+)